MGYFSTETSIIKNNVNSYELQIPKFQSMNYVYIYIYIYIYVNTVVEGRGEHRGPQSIGNLGVSGRSSIMAFLEIVGFEREHRVKLLALTVLA